MPRASTFTTYINTEEAPGAYSAIDKFAAKVTEKYATITRAADAAARAAAGISGGLGSAGRGTGGDAAARQYRTLADAQRAVAKAAARSNEALSTNRAALREQGAAASSASQQNSRLAQSMRGAENANDRLAQSLRTTSTLLGVVQGPLGPIAGRLSALSAAVQQFSGLQQGVAGLLGIAFAVGRLGNEYTVLQSKLRPFFETQQQANAAFQEVIGIAQRARAPLESIADLYGRLSSIGNEVGISQDRIARITEVAAKAATISGGTNETRRAGLSQFLQGIGSNNLGGDELRSVKENTFALAQAIAAGFKNADGSVGTTIANLKELGAQGKLTASAVADALERSSTRIEAQYSRLPLTLSQAATGFTNSLTVFVGRLDEAVQLSSTLASGVKLVGDYLGSIATVVAGVAAGFAAIKIGNFVQGIQATAAAQRQAADDTQRYTSYWANLAQQQIQAGQNTRASLEAERAQIQQNIDFLKRKADAARRDAIREAPSDVSPGSERRVTAALQERQEALRGAIRETERLRVVNGLLRDADRQVAAGQQRLAEATANTATRMSFLGRAVRTLWSAINPLGLAVGFLVGALITLATQTSVAQQTLDRAGSSAVETAKKALQLAGANERLAASYIAVSRAAATEEVRKKRDDLTKNRSEFAGRLSALADEFGRYRAYDRTPGAQPQIQAELKRYAEQIARGRPEDNVNNALITRRLAQLQQRFPERFRGSFLNLTYDKTGSAFNTQVVANSVAEQGYQEALRAQQDNETQIKQLLAQRSTPGAKGGAKAPSLRTTDIAAEAAAAAIDDGTKTIRAAGTRRTLALKQLDQEFGVSKGQVPADKRADYLARRTEIEQAYNAEVKGIKDASAAASAAKRAGRQAELQGRRDNLDAAATKRDSALLDLLKNGPPQGTAEFLQRRQEILATYDREANAVEGVRAASSTALRQQIADQKALEQAANDNAQAVQTITDRWNEQPRIVDQAARDIQRIQKLLGQPKDDKGGRYTQTDVALGIAAVNVGVRRPIEESLKARERELEISGLLLQGREAEAEAQRRVNELRTTNGQIAEADYQRILAQVQGEQRINDALAQRERLASIVRDTFQAGKDAVEQFFVDLPQRGPAAFGDLFRNLQSTLLRATARRITESIFEGSDAKIRALTSGQSSVDAAIYKFSGSIGGAGQATDSLVSSTQKAADAATSFAKALNDARDVVEGIPQQGYPSAPGNPGGAGGSLTNAITTSLPGVIQQVQTDAATNFARALNTARKVEPARPGDAINSVVGSVFKKFDEVVNELRGFKRQSDGTLKDSAGNLVTGSKFFTKIGDAVGAGLQGAAKGSFASAIAGAVGVPQDQTGAAIGGGIGGLLKSIKPLAKALGPAAAFLEPVLGIFGGLLGGLFQSAPRASATITSVDQKVNVTGNNADAKAGVSQAARTVQSGLSQIADALNAEIGDFAVSISKYKTSYRVDPTGSGSDGGKYGKNGGVLKFDDNDLEGAVQAAIANAISDGAIKGIRQGTQKLLQSGQDLSRALQKAVSFEQVFKDLKARTDPVGAAVDEVNTKFTRLKNIFKEAGASAQEFADLQQLYDFERADAIKQATEAARGAIDQFLKDMVGSSSSPLNKRTTYENAQAELNKLGNDVLAGKKVDQNDLLAAARNFQDASRALYGSSSSFFKDFEELRSLLTRARDNADPSKIDSLAPSPLAADPEVQAKLAELGAGVQKQVDATNTQTQVLADQLQTMIDLMRGAGSGGGSAIDYLPGFGGLSTSNFR
ncbi:MAG: tape measure protein [Sphingomonas sp.]|nr:tape measure protein [Sphingomonas sp.]